VLSRPSLGSGKTTLLRNLVRHPEFRDTAVIVNEFGEVVSTDDLLETSEDDVTLLRGGCLLLHGSRGIWRQLSVGS